MIEPTLAELAALQGDKELSLPKPLTEGQLAVVAESCKLLSSVERRLDQAQAELRAVGVNIDFGPFRRAQEFLDLPYQRLHGVVLGHLDALERARQ